MMTSREKILQTVLQNQPVSTKMPDVDFVGNRDQDSVDNYMKLFTGIGGNVFRSSGFEEMKAVILQQFDSTKRFVTTIPALQDVAELYSPLADPHSFHDVELAIIRAQFAVAENGAAWFPEELMGHRILPFICQHLAVVVSVHDILPTMHEAYAVIGEGDYGFGSFIAGPSKTADIEQALVMGAHGPISMTVFIMNDQATIQE